MAKKLPRAKESTMSTGIGNITLVGADTGCLSFVDAGAVNGDILELVVEDSNGNWEYGYYPYSAGVLTRAGSVVASSNSNNPINLSGVASVYSDFLAESILGNKKIQPAQLTANQNDWDPADATTSSKIGTVIDFTTDASRNITGLKAAADGDIRILRNRGSNDGVLQDEGSSTSSSAANRFSFGADIVVRPKETTVIQYDGGSSRWRAIGGSALKKSGVTAGTYGGATAIPSVTVDAQGRVTSASQTTVQQNHVWLAGSDMNGLSEVDFTSLDTTNYKYFIVRARRITAASGTPNMKIQCGTSTGPTWQTSSYQTFNNNSDTSAYFFRGWDSGSNCGINIDFTIGYDLAATAIKTAIYQAYMISSGDVVGYSGGGNWNNTTAITALRVLLSVTANGGRVDIWGVRTS